MIRVGIIGYGFMGHAHRDAYMKDDRAEVVCIADPRPDALQRSATGNLVAPESSPGRSPGDSPLQHHATIEELLADESIAAVSICTPTPLHPGHARSALEAGKHVLVEKPLALHGAATQDLLRVSNSNPALLCLPAMCMRFWPGWRWLHDVVRERRYGVVRAAHFARVGGEPAWGNGFYQDAGRCGGAAVDLHIHDTDFIRYCLGEPDGVESVGSTGTSGGIDFIHTTYHFQDGPAPVTAIGGWVPSPGYSFAMTYLAIFESAVAVFDSAATHPLVLHEGGEGRPVDLEEGMGYEHEVRHFLDCIEQGTQSTVVTLKDAVDSLRLVEREILQVSADNSQPR